VDIPSTFCSSKTNQQSYRSLEKNEINFNLTIKNSTFGIFLKTDVLLPHKICKNCITELEKSEDFKRNIVTSNERLDRELLIILDKELINYGSGKMKMPVMKVYMKLEIKMKLYYHPTKNEKEA
jgi:hypothetical protein